MRKFWIPFSALTLPARCFCDDKEKDKYWGTILSAEGRSIFYNYKTGEEIKEKPKDFKVLWDDNWDKRRPNENGPCASSKVIHQIILIRHGQYNYRNNEEKLTLLGRQQASATGERLRELFEKRTLAPVRNIFYSTNPRAQETHDLLLEKLLIQKTVPIEFPKSKPCTMIREAAVAIPEPGYPNWRPTEEEFDTDGTRILAAFKTYFYRPSFEDKEPFSTVLVCHGNVIRYFIMKALQNHESGWGRLQVLNGSISIIEIRSDGKVSMRGMSDVGHFPSHLITDNDKNMVF